jgi:hypothetical protein
MKYQFYTDQTGLHHKPYFYFRSSIMLFFWYKFITTIEDLEFEMIENNLKIKK